MDGVRRDPAAPSSEHPRAGCQPGLSTKPTLVTASPPPGTDRFWLTLLGTRQSLSTRSGISGSPVRFVRHYFSYGYELWSAVAPPLLIRRASAVGAADQSRMSAPNGHLFTCEEHQS